MPLRTIQRSKNPFLFGRLETSSGASLGAHEYRAFRLLQVFRCPGVEWIIGNQPITSARRLHTRPHLMPQKGPGILMNFVERDSVQPAARKFAISRKTAQTPSPLSWGVEEGAPKSIQSPHFLSSQSKLESLVHAAIGYRISFALKPIVVE